MRLIQRFSVLAVLLLVSVLLLAGAFALAQSAEQVKLDVDREHRTVRVLSARKVAARKVIEEFLTAFGEKSEIAADINNKVSIDIRDASFEEALRNLLGACNATYRLSGGGAYMVSVRFPGETKGEPADWKDVILDKVDFDAVDVRSAIRTLMLRTGAYFSMSPEVQGTVTVQLRNVRADSAIVNVLKQVDAVFREEGGVVMMEKQRPKPLIHLAVQMGDQPIENELRDLMEHLKGTYRVEGGIYKLATENGEVWADLQLMWPDEKERYAITQDNKWLYIVRGNQLLKVSKPDMKVVSETTLPPAHKIRIQH